MTTSKNLSMEATMMQFAFTAYTSKPQMVENYARLDEADLLALVKGVGFDGAYTVNKIAVELGWAHATSHGWTWRPEWLNELKKNGHLAYFYILVKYSNENVAAQRALHR